MNGVIDIMAVIFLAAVAVKLVVVLINPKSWLDFVKNVWKYPGLLMLISLALAILTLYYLLENGVTIVQIFAVMLFVSFLGAVGVAVYAKEMMGFAEKLVKSKDLIKRSGFYILIWIVLIIWGAKEIFFAA